VPVWSRRIADKVGQTAVQGSTAVLCNQLSSVVRSHCHAMRKGHSYGLVCGPHIQCTMRLLYFVCIARNGPDNAEILSIQCADDCLKLSSHLGAQYPSVMPRKLRNNFFCFSREHARELTVFWFRLRQTDKVVLRLGFLRNPCQKGATETCKTSRYPSLTDAHR
jgi:hypothetical protein